MPRYPVDNRIKIPSHIPFGLPDPNSRWKRHAGDDSANASGTPVYAPASGVVTGYTGDQYQGLVVEIRDSNGLYPHTFHLRSREASPGQSVTEGQLIGYTGSTGLSSGPHIHFGVGKKSLPDIKSFDEFIDPMEYIKGGGDMPSKVDIDRVNELFVAYWTRPQIEAEAQKAGKTVDQWLQGWVGTESNSLIKSLAESPQYRNKRLDAENELATLKKQLKDCQAGGTVLAPGKYLVN